MSIELRPVQPTPASHTLPILKTFVSPYTGIVQTVGEFARATDEPSFIGYGGSLARGERVIGQPLPEYSGGSHWDRKLALAATLGEAIERYSSAYVPEDQLVFACAKDLEGAAPPERFTLFHPDQYRSSGFPWVPFTDETTIAWIKGFELATGDDVYLPAQLVFLVRDRVQPSEQWIGYSTSSGIACAAIMEEAILKALLELVERDAFMITWSNRLSLPRLDPIGDTRLAAADARFAATGLRYAAVDLSAYLGIPTALGVVHGAKGETGALGVGASSAVNIADAYQKALSEAFAVHTHVRDKIYEHPDAIPAGPEQVNTFDDHIFFYAHEERAEYASFLDDSDELRRTSDVPDLPGGNLKEKIEAATYLLQRRGVSAYAVDLTSPDVRQSGLVVMRVVCPELCPLDVVERARFLGGSRLYRAAWEAGLAPKPFELTDLNPYPHPFP